MNIIEVQCDRVSTNQIPDYITLRRFLNPLFNLNRTKKVKNKEFSKKSNSKKPDLKKSNVKNLCSNQNSNVIASQINKKPEVININQPENKINETLNYDDSKIKIDSILNECIICLNHIPNHNFNFKLVCNHSTCNDCLKKYLKIEISESRINITCPKCGELIHPNLIQEVLINDDYLIKYENFMLRRILITDPNTRWCPGLDCNYAVIADDCSKCPILNCERKECGIQFCYYCKQEWHPNKSCNNTKLSFFKLLFKNKKFDTNANEYEIKEKKLKNKKKSNSLEQSSEDLTVKKLPSDNFSEIKVNEKNLKSDKIIENDNLPSSSSSQQKKLLHNENDNVSSSTSSLVFENSLQPTYINLEEFNLNQEDMKPCPCCKILIFKIKDGSCNQITCSICGTEFCWLCLKKTSDLHYFIPSGCTFWGKKPWSKKKKIFWQISMLIGAPVAIILIAGIAIPVIIIGIPVWFGRKLKLLLSKKIYSSKLKTFIIACGVFTSILISPMMAVGAVTIGVPFLLAYVYGIVPISLFRDQNCTVKTTSTGFKFEPEKNIQKKKKNFRNENRI